MHVSDTDRLMEGRRRNVPPLINCNVLKEYSQIRFQTDFLHEIKRHSKWQGSHFLRVCEIKRRFLSNLDIQQGMNIKQLNHICLPAVRYGQNDPKLMLKKIFHTPWWPSQVCGWHDLDERKIHYQMARQKIGFLIQYNKSIMVYHTCSCLG